MAIISPEKKKMSLLFSTISFITEGVKYVLRLLGLM